MRVIVTDIIESSCDTWVVHMHTDQNYQTVTATAHRTRPIFGGKTRWRIDLPTELTNLLHRDCQGHLHGALVEVLEEQT
jgi:hypothetical protein